MFLIFLLPGFLLWSLVIAVNLIKTGKLRFGFAFSVRNYYLIMSGFLLGPIFASLKARSIFPLLFFAIFALAGVLGEILFSSWWQTFYENQFWTYHIKALAQGRTSFLNFVPWGIGGTLYLIILQLYRIVSTKNFYSPGAAAPVPFWVFFILGALLGLLIQILVRLVFWQISNENLRFKKAAPGNYLFFCLPYFIGLSLCAIVYGLSFIYLALAFAIIGAAAEYLFGKLVNFFIAEKLWSYNYLPLDKGHFTFLSLIPFSAAGFYFWAVALMIGLFH